MNIRDFELHYQNMLFIVFKLVGFYVSKVSYFTRTHIDLVLQTEHFIYVMEFKLEGLPKKLCNKSMKNIMCKRLLPTNSKYSR